MKFSSAVCILVLAIISLQSKLARCETLAVIEEVVFEEEDDEAFMDSMTTIGETDPPENTTSVTTPTTSATTPTTTRAPPIDAPQPLPPSFVDVEVEIDAVLTLVNELFNINLTFPNHPEYIRLVGVTKSEMDFAFRGNSRYLETTVRGFRSSTSRNQRAAATGTVIADTLILMQDLLDKSSGNFSFCKEAEDIEGTTNITFFNGSGCDVYLQAKVQSTCQTSTAMCPSTWRCRLINSNPTCQHPCYIAKSDDATFCSSSSQVCSVRLDGNDASAECTCLGSYLNVGDSCLHQNFIIIAASVVGGILLIVFIALIATMAVRLNRKPYEHMESYQQPKGGNRAADLWASIPDEDTSRKLNPYADEFVSKTEAAEEKKADQWPKSESPRDSDSGRMTSGNDNQAFVGDDNVRGWSNIALDDAEKGKDLHRSRLDDIDQNSEPSVMDIDDSYMRSLLSSDAYQEIGERDFKISRPVLRMDNLNKNAANTKKDEEKSEGEEFVF